MNEQGWNQCSTPAADRCVTSTPKVRRYKWYRLLTAFQAAVWTGLSRGSLCLRHTLSAGANQAKAVVCACTFVLLACQGSSSVSESDFQALLGFILKTVLGSYENPLAFLRLNGQGSKERHWPMGGDPHVVMYDHWKLYQCVPKKVQVIFKNHICIHSWRISCNMH